MKRNDFTRHLGVRCKLSAVGLNQMTNLQLIQIRRPD